MERKPVVIAISGAKNTGKTTLLTNLIPRLKDKGLKVAAIKHDYHGFDADVPGTDSRRLFDAGANGVAVYSSQKYMIVRREKDSTVEHMICQFPDVDLILLEGNKNSPYPKIEIIRREIAQQSVCDPATLLALYTDTDLEIAEVPKIAMNDYDGAVACIISHCQKNQNSR